MGKLTQVRRSGNGKRPERSNSIAGDVSFLVGSRGSLAAAAPPPKPPALPATKPTLAGFAAVAAAKVSKLASSKAKQKLKDQKKHERRRAEWEKATPEEQQRIKASLSRAASRAAQDPWDMD